MRRSILLLCVVIMSVLGVMPAFAQSANGKSDFVEVLYFHGKQRCVSCKAIEANTREELRRDFAKELKSGKVRFKEIDISTAEGRKIADRYEVTWSSLFVNKWKGGKETRNNLTDYGFSYAKGSPEVFKAGLKKKINSLLK